MNLCEGRTAHLHVHLHLQYTAPEPHAARKHTMVTQLLKFLEDRIATNPVFSVLYLHCISFSSNRLSYLNETISCLEYLFFNLPLNTTNIHTCMYSGGTWATHTQIWLQPFLIWFYMHLCAYIVHLQHMSEIYWSCMLAARVFNLQCICTSEWWPVFIVANRPRTSRTVPDGPFVNLVPEF